MNKEKQLKLSQKLIIGIVLVTFLGLAIAFLIIDTVVRDIVENNIQNLNLQQNAVYAKQVDAWLAKTQTITDNLAISLINAGTNNITAFETAILNEYDFVCDVYIGFSDGEVGGLHGWVPPPEVIVYTRPWYILAQSAPLGTTVMTTPYVDASSGSLVATVSRNLGNIGERTAVTAIDISLDSIIKMLDSFEVAGGGYLILTDPTGNIIYIPDKNYMPQADGLKNLSSVPGYDDLLKQLERTNDIVRLNDYQGVSSDFMLYNLDSTNWVLIAVIPSTVTTTPLWRTLTIIMLTIALILCIVAVFTMLYMSKQIRKTINKSVLGFHARSVALAEGKSIAYNGAADNSFGLDEIDKEFSVNLSIVAGLINDIEDMHTAHIAGSYKYLADSSRYEGAYAKIIDSVNDIAEHHTNSKLEILNCVSKIANGDFEASIRQYPGDEHYINDAVEALRANIIDATTEIKAVIKAAVVDGDLAFQVNESKYQGGWRNIMKGLNEICRAVDAPIVEIRDAVAALSRGEFNRSVTGSYNGDFLAIKNDVNQLVLDLAKYIGEIEKCLNEVNSGNLTHTITADFGGGYARMKQSINNIVATLHKTMTEISLSSEQVLAGAKQISDSAMDLASGATNQATAVEQLNASIDLINEQTKQNAKSADDANSLSGKSTDNAREGNNAMGKMLEAMNEIKESSHNISRIIKVIQEIAFQTNMLALNAAVEAARAGEHGKGFAVVAEEVRSLAERSQKAAEETTGLIEDSISHIDAGSGITEATANALNIIVENANEVSQIIDSISVSSKEQAEAVEQVSVGVNQISSVVQNNSAISQETAAAATELNSQAALLQKLVAYFKL